MLGGWASTLTYLLEGQTMAPQMAIFTFHLIGHLFMLDQ